MMEDGLATPLVGRTTPLTVAFAGGNGFPPEDSGGVQNSTDDLAQRLLDRGDAPQVLAPLYGRGVFGVKARAKLKLARGDLICDTRSGYPVFRAWFPETCVTEFVDRVAPNVAVVQCHGTVPLAKAFRDMDVPVVIYLRNVEFDELQGDLTEFSNCQFIANSSFTAKTYGRAFGIKATVIPPTIDPNRFRTAGVGTYVTFVNPVPQKGLELALALAAACPDIPFLFQESWHLDGYALANLRASIASLPNVRFAHRTDDIRSVYAQTRLLLAPSKWAEAWGRIASEAQVNGIPVLGSTSGGLPEAIGPAGVTLDYDAGPEVWTRALRAIWDTPDRYDALRRAAFDHASRPEMQADQQFETFRAVLMRAIGGH